MSEQASGESDTCREIAWSDSKPDGAYCLERQRHIEISPSVHVLGLTCTWPIHSLDMEACWKSSQNVMSIYKARVLVKTGRPLYMYDVGRCLSGPREGFQPQNRYNALFHPRCGGHGRFKLTY